MKKLLLLAAAFILLAGPKADSASRNFVGCTVGGASAVCLAGGKGKTFLQIENVHSTNTIACAWGTAAVLNDKGSIQLASGQAASWGQMTAGVPSDDLNCIASGGGTPLYVEWL